MVDESIMKPSVLRRVKESVQGHVRSLTAKPELFSAHIPATHPTEFSSFQPGTDDIEQQHNFFLESLIWSQF